MILDNYYVNYSKNIESYSILSYRNFLTKFINQFINIYKEKYGNEIYNKAIVYSKYYLFYKTMECEYNKDVMEIIYNVEFHINKKIKD